MSDFSGLVGKTIVAANRMVDKRYDDRGFLKLEFSDGSSVLLHGSYNDYSGNSMGEYSEFIFIDDSPEDEYGEALVLVTEMEEAAQ